MPRTMFQVLIIPFRRTAAGIEYAALKRSDCGAWQGVAGGGEDNESAAEAALREVAEETGLADGIKLYRLKTNCSIPITYFAEAVTWPPGTYVIQEYAFALDCTGRAIDLSEEHEDIRWGTFEEINSLLTYDSNRTALWELSERLRLDDLHLA